MGHNKTFRKFIGRWNPDAYPAVLHIFNKLDPRAAADLTNFPKIAVYQELREAAQSRNATKFQKVAEKKVLPEETLMGFRNMYKVPIEQKKVLETGTMSERKKLQMQSTAKRTGTKVSVDYTKQELYDLWKLFYHKILQDDKDDIKKVSDAIAAQSMNASKLDFGETVVIMDCSYSMVGSEKRKLHPILTALSIVPMISNVKKVIPVGGEFIHEDVSGQDVVIPFGGTELWKALVEAVSLMPDTVILISDMYENCIKGMFQHIYDALKQEHEFHLVQINPVFAAEVEGVRKVVEDAPLLAVENPKYFKTSYIFGLLSTHRGQVKDLLVREYVGLMAKEQGRIKS